LLDFVRFIGTEYKVLSVSFLLEGATIPDVPDDGVEPPETEADYPEFDEEACMSKADAMSANDSSEAAVSDAVPSSKPTEQLDWFGNPINPDTAPSR